MPTCRGEAFDGSAASATTPSAPVSPPAATINFTPSKKRIRVVKTIDILATGDNDRMQLDQFTERFTFVPEPSSLGLAAMGLVALRRRRK